MSRPCRTFRGKRHASGYSRARGGGPSCRGGSVLQVDGQVAGGPRSRGRSSGQFLSQNFRVPTGRHTTNFSCSRSLNTFTQAGHASPQYTSAHPSIPSNHFPIYLTRPSWMVRISCSKPRSSCRRTRTHLIAKSISHHGEESECLSISASVEQYHNASHAVADNQAASRRLIRISLR
jgi:hypothetical protein